MPAYQHEIDDPVDRLVAEGVLAIEPDKAEKIRANRELAQSMMGHLRVATPHYWVGALGSTVLVMPHLCGLKQALSGMPDADTVYIEQIAV